MLNYSKVIQKCDAFNIIKRDKESNRLSHAYLVVSQDENYLAMFCEYVCKLLINQGDEEVINKNNLRIEKQIHPDVKIFGKEKAITADLADEIIEAAEYSPFEADKKIFVIFNVHDMNETSQNKILKTIEEPPKNTYFILAALGTSRILQTILSRVKEIKLESISREEIVSMLVESNVPQNNAEIFASCANGNAGFAEKFALQSGFVEFYNNILMLLFNLDGSKDVLKYSAEFNSKKINKDEFFDICNILIRDLLMILSQKDELVANQNVLPQLKAISKKLNSELALELMDMCLKCKQMLLINVNSTSVIDEFLYKLAEVKVRCRKL